jgi:DNA-binding beta-propeller fold protein YncE
MDTARSLLSTLRPVLAMAALMSIDVPAARADGGDDGYQAVVIAAGLLKPTGIAVSRHGDIYFTQLPTPGVPGMAGGSNTVSMLDAQTGAISTISAGEPEPTHIDITRQGELFWTCKSAGVILKHNDCGIMLVRAGLLHPSGIAVQDRGPNKGDIYFTQLPTPGIGGMMGGTNTVSVLVDGVITHLTVGEPEPTDIAVDRKDNLYWTCKSANVILQLDGDSGEVSLLLGGLHRPSGIALDNKGNLYFTEVPTPGTPGSQGGQNRVWRYDLDDEELVLVDEGDPEPTDIAVSGNGKKIYWTCTSAGVIVLAQPLDDDDDDDD